jgi:hypothetical protein
MKRPEFYTTMIWEWWKSLRLYLTIFWALYQLWAHLIHKVNKIEGKIACCAWSTIQIVLK